jgi:hypothetical protein
VLRILALTVLLFFPASALVGYATSPPTIVPTDWFHKEVGTVRVCPSPELTHDTEKAVEEWNTAIAFFSVRFGWLELLGLRLEVAETGCNAYIVIGKTPGGTNSITLPARDDNNRTVFVIAVSDTLQPERRVGVITHELIHVLGLLDGYSPKAPFKPVTDASGLGRVTSHDIYALYAKYVRGADNALVSVPPHIPYMTADMPLPDIVSAGVSALAAFMIDRKLRGRKNK